MKTNIARNGLAFGVWSEHYRGEVDGARHASGVLSWRDFAIIRPNGIGSSKRLN
jgi:hypothetical protein